VHQTNVGGHVLRQSGTRDADPAQSTPTSPGKSPGQPARRLLSLKAVGEKLGTGERTAHNITLESWFPPAIVLGPRIRRWDEAEIDAAIAARAPRRTERVEPQQLLRARVERLKAGTAGARE